MNLYEDTLVNTSYTTTICIPTDIETTPKHIRCIQPIRKNSGSKENSRCKQRYQLVNKAYQQILGHITYNEDNLATVPMHNPSTKIQMASDGSVKDNNGGYGYIAEWKGKTLFSGGNSIKANHYTLNSTHMEALGALACYIALVTIIPQPTKKESPHFQFFTDNSAVEKMINNSKETSYKKDEFPIINEIVNIRRWINNGECLWIRSHTNEESTESLLNAEADRLAARFRQEQSPRLKLTMLPNAPIMFNVQK